MEKVVESSEAQDESRERRSTTETPPPTPSAYTAEAEASLVKGKKLIIGFEENPVKTNVLLTKICYKRSEYTLILKYKQLNYKQ